MAGPSWDTNTVGPYTVLRRLRGAILPRAGRLYAALHRTTGRPALVVAPTGQKPYHAGAEWLLRVRLPVEPSPFVALEVEHAPAPSAPLRQVADGLHAITCALDKLEGRQEVAEHLARTTSPSAQSVTPWPRALAVAALIVVAACMGLMWLPFRRAASEAPSRPETTAATVADEALAAPEELPVDSVDLQVQWHGVSLDMPTKPFKGQRKAPCEEGAEVEIQLKDGSRACWVWIGSYSAQVCKTRGYEHEGRCYLPSIPGPRQPTSTRDQEVTPVPSAPAQ